MTPSLARLMNLVWLHEQNHFDDEQLCDVLRDGLSKDVLEQWNAYKRRKATRITIWKLASLERNKKLLATTRLGLLATRLANGRSMFFGS